MKIITPRAIILIATILVFCGNAGAETVNIDVPAGRTTAIHQYALYSRANCASAQRPELSVKSVKNGKVTSQNHSGTITSGNCKGRTIKSTVALYTPNRGFRGKDTVKITYKSD